MDDRYNYLTKKTEATSFEEILEYLKQFTRPSGFHQALSKLLSSQRNIFNTLPQEQKNDDLYTRRKAELQKLEDTLRESQLILTSQIQDAQETKSKLARFNNPSSMQLLLSTEHITDTIIANSPRLLPNIHLDYYADDTELYYMCNKIVSGTEKPLIEYFRFSGVNRNNFITELEDLLAGVKNEKMTIHLNHDQVLLFNRFFLEKTQEYIHKLESEERGEKILKTEHFSASAAPKKQTTLGDHSSFNKNSSTIFSPKNPANRTLSPIQKRSYYTGFSSELRPDETHPFPF